VANPRNVMNPGVHLLEPGGPRGSAGQRRGPASLARTARWSEHHRPRIWPGRWPAAPVRTGPMARCTGT